MSIPNGLQKAKCQFNLSGRLRDLNLVSKRIACFCFIHKHNIRRMNRKISKLSAD
jgi:hypothetical protein